MFDELSIESHPFKPILKTHDRLIFLLDNQSNNKYDP